jgi:hypothetical protein
MPTCPTWGALVVLAAGGEGRRFCPLILNSTGGDQILVSRGVYVSLRRTRKYSCKDYSGNHR